MDEKERVAQCELIPAHLTPPLPIIPPPVPASEDRPLDRVKPPTEKKKNRYHER